MSYEPKDMTGTLFRNKEKKTDKSPDYTGTVKIHGATLRIAGWAKGSPPYLSLAFQIPRNETGKQKAPAAREPGMDDDTDLPF